MLTPQQESQLVEKKNIEYHTFKYFARWQQVETGNNYDFIRFGIEPEPDIIASKNSLPIGIEVATIYGSKYGAARLLGRITPGQFEEEIFQEDLIPLIRVEYELKGKVAEKQTKIYSLDSPVLVIRNAFPLYEKNDFQHLRMSFLPGIFSQIWLVCDRAGTSGILQIG